MLESHNIPIEETVDARKTRFTAETAWPLLQQATTILTAKGRKINRWSPQTDEQAAILNEVLGRSGNLRAPTLKLDDTFIVGYNEALYNQTFNE